MDGWRGGLRGIVLDDMILRLSFLLVLFAWGNYYKWALLSPISNHVLMVSECVVMFLRAPALAVCTNLFSYLVDQLLRLLLLLPA